MRVRTRDESGGSLLTDGEEQEYSPQAKFPYFLQGHQLNRWKDLTKNGTTKVVPFFAL